MADEEHAAMLSAGVKVWNRWRQENDLEHPDLTDFRSTSASLKRIDLSGANLANAGLYGANLTGANISNASLVCADLRDANLSTVALSEADLNEADLNGTTLHRANLRSANLHCAMLHRTNFSRADLTNANLQGANLFSASLSYTNFTGADLRDADMSRTVLFETVFGNVDLTETIGLDTCIHIGPSIVDHRTLERSRNVPLSFWQGCGLPNTLIDYMPSLTGEALKFYSCFISYSSNDQEFADRLHADLQNKGVRCWFAPHDLPIGKNILDGLDEAIRLRDKVVLILSEDAIGSDWVEDEVSTAFEEERRRKETILFPIQLDDAVMNTDEAWAAKLRSRNIGDFRKWKNHDAYKIALDRVLRDLRSES